MTAETILETVRQVGGTLWVDGEKLRYRLPAERSDLIPAMRELKSEILSLLSERPAMPAGCVLVRWELKPAPVQLSPWETVTNPALFARSTLLQVEARLSGKDWLAGNWTLSTLFDRLAAVGCYVALENPKAALQ